jgi:hypothetical protein
MNLMRTGTFSVTLLLGALLAGCCGGGTTAPVVVAPGSGATVGQELSELKDAYENGAISEAEYKKLKQATMDKARK